MPKSNGFALSVLIVEDDAVVAEWERLVLADAGLGQEIVTIGGGEDLMPTLRGRDCGVVLLDLSLPDASGEKLLGELRAEHPQIPVIIVTGDDGTDTAVRCMRAGAYDYLVKPLAPERLVADVRNALELRTLEIEKKLLISSFVRRDAPATAAFDAIITRNERMRMIFRYIEGVARSPKAVLVTGETGTGKELIARAVHLASGRAGGFHAVNTAEFDDAMFSDALFGHRKGAYTGAEDRRRGLVESAETGTLFLDEIGDLGLRAQAKLLRLVENGEYLPLGSDEVRRSGVRIVAATNRDLDAAVEDGTFRRDLYYRLSVHRIHLPPLRERRDDIPLLFDHFLEKARLSLGLRETPCFAPGLVDALAAYEYPGNIREFESVVYDAVGRAAGKCLEEAAAALPAPAPAPRRGTAAPEGGFDFSGTLPSLKELKDRLFQEALGRCGGSQSAAAKLIGVSQQTLSDWAHARAEATGIR